MSFKKCRKAAGLMQQFVAEKIGVSVQTVWLWETGKNLPSADKLVKLAQLYNCTVDELLKEE